MIDIKDIFPECDADTLLVELITRQGHANHNKGVSKVSKALKKNAHKLGPLIGIIDSDKFKRLDQDPYLPAFNEVICDHIEGDEKLRLNKLPNKQHYLISVHPEFEPWIWAQATLSGLNFDDYGYENDFDGFEGDSKRYGMVESAKFKKFVNAVIIANPPGVLMLRRWLIDKDFQNSAHQFSASNSASLSASKKRPKKKRSEKEALKRQNP
jgi:hypothetical protein